jgi:enamine deaminase RidA (YjgF/YER057c/UK114 family)
VERGVRSNSDRRCREPEESARIRPRDKEHTVTSNDRQPEAVIPPAMAEPAAFYGYSPGVIVPAGDLLFVSGQIGRDPTGNVVADPEQQFVAAFENLQSILVQAGATMADVIDLTTFHTSMADITLFAKVKARFLDTTPRPAWTAIGTTELALPGVLVEIKATASL